MAEVNPKPEDVEIPSDVEWEDLTPFQRWYYKNKESHKENVRSRESELVSWLNKLKSSLECEECGEDHPACIELHHTEQNEYDLRIGNMAREGYSKETIYQ